jgi:hypothetical protein
MPLLQPVDAGPESTLFKFIPSAGLGEPDDIIPLLLSIFVFSISHQHLSQTSGVAAGTGLLFPSLGGGTCKAEREPCFSFFLPKLLVLMTDFTVRGLLRESLHTLLPFPEEEDIVCNIPFRTFFDIDALFPNFLGEESFSGNSTLLPSVLQQDEEEADI